jgi:hypothetical protein
MKWDADLAHRTLWTFIQTFTGVLVASSMLNVNMTVIAAAASAAIADVLVLVKEYARRQLAGASNGTDQP